MFYVFERLRTVAPLIKIIIIIIMDIADGDD